MSFVSQWRRRILAAAGAGATVPLVILVAALLVGVGGGGIAGLGSLSQALTGPAVPDADASALERRRTRPTGDAGDLLAQVRPPAVPAGSGGTGSPGTPGDTGDDSSRGDNPPSGPRPTPAPGSGRPPAPGTGGSPPPAAPTPAPTEPPSALRQTGETVAKQVEGVPVVGPTGAQVIRQTVQTVDEILPLLRLRSGR